MPKPYERLSPPFVCPWCEKVTTTSAKEHKKHLEEHEREEQQGRPQLLELEASE